MHHSTDSTPKLAPGSPASRSQAARDLPARSVAVAAPPKAGRGARRPTLEELWRRYARRRDDEHRNLLVERYQALVTDMVRRYAQRLPRNVDRGDLETAANVGLMGAIEGFDPARGVKFEAYCEFRVRGALLDELRTQDWLPRTWRARIEQHKRALERLRAELEREPDDAEVARELGLSLSAYRHLYGAFLPGAPLGSMPAVDGEDADVPPLEVVPDASSPSAEERLTAGDVLRLVAQRLSVREYRLVYLRYWEELSMREIGEFMRLSESRVCKMHQQLIERLQQGLCAAE
jgi:RNA polymerase sigma factor for flagellar operon FliA